MRAPVFLLILPLFAGCQFLPQTHYFTPPENEPNPAWVRIVNFTQHADIYQYPDGVRTGGVVRSGPLPFVHTQDMGMPKAGQKLTFDYYETPVRPGIQTRIGMSWQGERTRSCFVSAQFTPQAGHYYQFKLTSGDSGTCTLYSSHIEQSADGAWTLRPNTEVSYPYGGPEHKTTYSNEQYRDPDYKPFVPPT